MRAREIGPATSSGRITAIEALYMNTEPGKKDKRLTIYVGSAAGGVYKSKDNGTTFEAIFEKESINLLDAWLEIHVINILSFGSVPVNRM